MKSSPGDTVILDLRYLYVELRTADVELLCGQEPLLTGGVLQDDRQVDQVVSHHILILDWQDLSVENLSWRCRGQQKRGSR